MGSTNSLNLFKLPSWHSLISLSEMTVKTVSEAKFDRMCKGYSWEICFQPESWQTLYVLQIQTSWFGPARVSYFSYSFKSKKYCAYKQNECSRGKKIVAWHSKGEDVLHIHHTSWVFFQGRAAKIQGGVNAPLPWMNPQDQLLATRFQTGKR